MMRSMFLAGLLLLAADVQSQERARFCGRASSLTEITYVCGKGGGYVRLSSIMLAMNAKIGTQRYWTINEVHLHFYGSVTVPTNEPAFLQWVKENAGVEIGARNEKMITFRLPSNWTAPQQGKNR